MFGSLISPLVYTKSFCILYYFLLCCPTLKSYDNPYGLRTLINIKKKSKSQFTDSYGYFLALSATIPKIIKLEISV